MALESNGTLNGPFPGFWVCPYCLEVKVATDAAVSNHLEYCEEKPEEMDVDENSFSSQDLKGGYDDYEREGYGDDTD